MTEIKGNVEAEENPNVVIIDNMIAGNLEIEDTTTSASGNTVDGRILKPDFSSYQGPIFQKISSSRVELCLILF